MSEVVPTRVLVTFGIPGSGPDRQEYELGRADDLVVWSANERLSAAVQLSVKNLAAVTVNAGLAAHMHRSRAGMQPYVKRRLAEMRQRMDPRR